jgi:hypothetical protein
VIVQPAYAVPCVPPGHELVVIASGPPGAINVTVAVVVVDPLALVAVNVYVVVAVGLTLVEPVADDDVNVPGVMAMLVAPVAAQFSVLLAPEFMLVGFAVKDVIAGTEPIPEAEFDKYPEAQPESVAKKARVSTSAHSSSPEGFNPRKPSLSLQTVYGKSMRGPFTGNPGLVYRSWIGSDYWSQVQERLHGAGVLKAGSLQIRKNFTDSFGS